MHLRRYEKKTFGPPCHLLLQSRILHVEHILWLLKAACQLPEVTHFFLLALFLKHGNLQSEKGPEGAKG